MKKLNFLTLVIVCIFLTNCATIIHGAREEVAFSSRPSSATIKINGQDFGQTPKVIKLKRSGTYLIKIELPGYLPTELTIDHKVDGWIVGNVFIGGLIGIVIDASTGAMFHLTPDQINATLKSSNVMLNGNNMYISAVMNVDPSWEKIGTLKKANN
jgi:hypothetical protein